MIEWYRNRMFSFKRHCQTHFQRGGTFYIPAGDIWKSSFSSSSPACGGVSLSDRCAVIAYCGFNLRASNGWWCLCDCMCLFFICVSSLSLYVAPFLTGLTFFLYCWVLRVIYIFYIQQLCWILGLQIFSPGRSLIFSSSKDLGQSKTFNFVEV